MLPIPASPPIALLAEGASPSAAPLVGLWVGLALLVLVGLVTLRVVRGRFLPAPKPRQRPADAPDAWAEAGRRLTVSPEDDHAA